MRDDFNLYGDVWLLYQSAADKNDPGSQYWLAERTYDDVEAARWARMAAEQGHEPAQLMIGRLYYEGKGVPQNYTESANG